MSLYSKKRVLRTCPLEVQHGLWRPVPALERTLGVRRRGGGGGELFNVVLH